MDESASHESHTSPDELAVEVWEDESPALDPPSWLSSAHVGVTPQGWRSEHDSLGVVLVPDWAYWGAQTQRSLDYFSIGRQLPFDVVRALARVRRAAAVANAEVRALPEWKADAISKVCDEIADGVLDEHFPLVVYQTGSGTHTCANVNEVIANRANELLGTPRGSRSPIHPNDDVNMSQSTNDTFVTAMHLAAYDCLARETLPSLAELTASLDARAREWADVPKVGRTHLMDATTLTVGQEWSGYAYALSRSAALLEFASADLLEVAMGGTAVGTGVNVPAGFVEAALQELQSLVGFPVRGAANPFAAQATLDALVRTHGHLKAVAVTLFKIANDFRWMASGPRQGLQEIIIPANEPGSTIMPGKVNPTQCEAVMMVCLTVMGNDVTVSMAGAEGNFELNAFRPVVIADFLESARLLADGALSLARHLVDTVDLNHAQLRRNVERSVMVVTEWAPVIGYDLAAKIARHAVEHDVDVATAARHFGVEPDRMRSR